MTTPEKVATLLKGTHWIIHAEAEGLTHADSLAQPEFGHNCFNWVLGHIVEGRSRMLSALDLPPALTEEQAARYRRDSEPVVDDDTAVALDTLLAALDDSQERLLAALETVTDETWQTIFSEAHDMTIGDRLDGLHWHETYHTGQLNILRQITQDDKVI